MLLHSFVRRWTLSCLFAAHTADACHEGKQLVRVQAAQPLCICRLVSDPSTIQVLPNLERTCVLLDPALGRDLLHAVLQGWAKSDARMHPALST